MTNGMLGRRRFLREAAAGAAGVMAGPALMTGRAGGESTTADVLIIGAGMAGVSAGSALRAAGINPIILEGRSDRIGGRIWTSFTWSDAPVDLGASWLTHGSINPLARLNFYKYDKVPLLMCFNHDKYALQLEAMSETQVMDAAMQVLRKQYGRGIPDPVGIQRSRWGADPFAHGTIAHVPPGASGNDFELMGMPVGPLGFAGDSTTSLYPTLVFGAYLTGQREAARILNPMEDVSIQAAEQVTAPRTGRRRPASGATGQSPRLGRGEGSTAMSRNPDLEVRSALKPRPEAGHSSTATGAGISRSASHSGDRATRASARRPAGDNPGDRHREGAHADHDGSAQHRKKP